MFNDYLSFFALISTPGSPQNPTTEQIALLEKSRAIADVERTGEKLFLRLNSCPELVEGTSSVAALLKTKPKDIVRYPDSYRDY